MKKIIKHSLFLLGVTLGLSSCDKVDGPLYTPDPSKASFLTATGNIPMSNGEILVPVDRPSSIVGATIPVTLKVSHKDSLDYLAVFSAKDPIVFAEGESKGFAKVKYDDFSKINPTAFTVTASGLDVKVVMAFPFSLLISKYNIAPRDIQKIDVTASNTLEFEDKGNVEFDSRGGYAKAVSTVKIQKAKGANVYKVISPFGANNIAFSIRADGKVVTFPDQLAATNGTAPVTMKGVTGTVDGNKVTLTVSSYTSTAGNLPAGKEIITLPN